MSSYATTTDLYAFGAPAAALSTFTGAQQQGALDAAADVVDAAVGARFKLPLISWGASIRRCCAIIAAYDLLVVRGANPDSPLVKDLEARHESQLKWLEGISEGKYVPVVVDSQPGGGAGAQLGNFTSQAVVAPSAPAQLPAYGSGPSTTIATAAGVVAVGAPNLRGW